MARRCRVYAWSVLALLCHVGVALATDVLPPSFDDIRARAGAIALVETIHVRSDWRTSPQGKHIVTVVTFRVERGLKGQLGRELQLELLGGEVGTVRMEVEGMPQFRAGERDVLFLSPNRQSVSPIVGLYQGRFRVVGDRAAGTDRILTHNEKPFPPAPAGPHRLRTTLLSPIQPLSYAQFESLILQAEAAGALRR